MVETALFVSAALLFMLGTMQIGALGFLQLTADSAAYFDARANVLGVTSGSPESATHTAFDQVPVPDIQPTVLPAPTPSIPVDYGYNDPNPTVQANSAANRHGGASMMQPAQLLSSVGMPGLMHILGQSLGVTGTDIEAKWVECGPHFEIANAACSLSSPTSNQQTNYFTNGENTPLYFVGFNYIQNCGLSVNGPWGLYTGADANSYTSEFGGIAVASFNGPGSPPGNQSWQGPCASGSNNGNSDIGLTALGSAEYLDVTNWDDTSAGVSGPCDTSAQPAAGTNQSVFEAMAFHQREYATIAEYLQNNSSLVNVEQYSYEADSTINTNNFFGYYCGQNLCQSLLGVSAGALPGATGAGNVATPEVLTSGFTQWEGFDDANNYPGNNDIYNQAVQTVAGWDVSVGTGQPASDPTYSNPTFPEKGCT